jgi:hypothetical protein
MKFKIIKTLIKKSSEKNKKSKEEGLTRKTSYIQIRIE